MEVLRSLTPRFKQYLTELFEDHPQVDLALDSILEGQSGGNIGIIFDNAIQPHAAQIIQGSFTAFAGAADCRGAHDMVAGLTPGCFVQPCSDDWINLAYQIHGDRLKKSKRYSFSSASLDSSHLRELIY